jgi:hypothetical protein
MMTNSWKAAGIYTVDITDQKLNHIRDILNMFYNSAVLTSQ